ncbi:unnamed protein product [Schistocephalus solidus]|uniref:HTH LytTR-type domain-containing protein n=1 Tax=Schistocephalus solidus TaxID=70667 RepID=A0A183TCE5_SCHSO|nr:unnamed protein product [Schistocephalus solidus]
MTFLYLSALSPQDDVIPAVVEQTGDWEKLRLSRLDCYLRLTEDRLELLDGGSQRVLHWFPYLLIRRCASASIAEYAKRVHVKVNRQVLHREIDLPVVSFSKFLIYFRKLWDAESDP